MTTRAPSPTPSPVRGPSKEALKSALQVKHFRAWLEKQRGKDAIFHQNLTTGCAIARYLQEEYPDAWGVWVWPAYAQVGDAQVPLTKPLQRVSAMAGECTVGEIVSELTRKGEPRP